MHATTRQTPSVDVHDLPFLVVLLTIGLNLSFHVANCGFPRPPGNGTIVNCTSTARLYQCNSGLQLQLAAHTAVILPTGPNPELHW